MNGDTSETDTEITGKAQNVMLSEGEWNGLVSLLRAFEDGEPFRAVEGTKFGPHELAGNYADYIDENRRDWP